MSDELNPDLFDEEFEEDFEDGLDELDLDEEDLEDLEADLADDEGCSCEEDCICEA
jgi:hypothetical protein